MTLPLLEEISANDYGRDIARHLAGIKAQLRPNPPLGLPALWPREVLELERWSDPDRAYLDKTPTGERGHVKRLLACLILLRNGAYVNGTYGVSEEDFFLQTSAASLIRFTGSAFALKVPKLALGFLLWLFKLQKHPALRPFTAFCVLILAAAIDFDGMSEQEVLKICDWVDALERRSRKALRDHVDSEQWLTGINSYERRDRNEWLLVAQQVLNRPYRAYSAEAGLVLRRFLDRFAGT
jgi:hypothetical protein